MRFSIALVFVLGFPFSWAHSGEALAQPPAPQGTPAPPPDDTIVVIDTPPQPQPPEVTPSQGVILQRPGQVLLHGKPVRLDFRSPTDGVAFQLQAGGTYSSISGVSYGVGYGGYGWGYGGYGVGYGIAPYYGEVVTKAYQPICETPCRATLLSGRYRMALSLRGGAPVNVERPIGLSTDAIVEGRYVDKSRLRRAGWATFIAGSIAGMTMMFASVSYNNDPFATGSQIRNAGVFYTGVGVFVSSIIAGAVLAAQHDEAHVRVYPVN